MNPSRTTSVLRVTVIGLLSCAAAACSPSSEPASASAGASNAGAAGRSTAGEGGAGSGVGNGGTPAVGGSSPQAGAGSARAGAGAGGVADSSYMLPYYRLRVEFLDQADWANLIVVDPSKVIKGRKISQVGTANVLSVDKKQMALNTSFGSDLTVVADFALVPSAIDTPFDFSLTKGSAGSVTIRISSVIGDQVTLLKEITKQSGGLDFSVDLSGFKGVAPIQAPLAPVKNMGLALYYPWYYLEIWDPKAIDQPATLYGSDDPVAIDRQIDQAQSAGINAFIVSWIGPGSNSDKNLKIMLKEAAKKHFFIGFFLENTIADLVNHQDTAIEWLSYIASEYTDDPGVLKVGGRPVAIPYIASTIKSSVWAETRAAVRAKGKDVWLLQDCQDEDYYDVFDGVWYDGGIGGLGEKVRLYSVLADHPAPKLWISTAMPGFEKPGSDRYIDRANGAFFKAGLDAAFANSPQWVTMYTWNEWGEMTYIEPSVKYGDQYLKIAGSYLNGWVQQ